MLDCDNLRETCRFALIKSLDQAEADSYAFRLGIDIKNDRLAIDINRRIMGILALFSSLSAWLIQTALIQKSGKSAEFRILMDLRDETRFGGTDTRRSSHRIVAVIELV